jgi:anti-sigma B factor antagonist
MSFLYGNVRELQMGMTTSTRQIGGVTVVDIKGPIVLGDGSPSVRDVVFELLSHGQKQILLNLGAVSYVDSMGLGSLVGALVTARKQGGELKLLNVSAKVTYVMQITKLYAVFDIVKDEDSGVKSFDHSAVAAA